MVDSLRPRLMSAAAFTVSELRGSESSGSNRLDAAELPSLFASMSHRHHAVAAAQRSDSVALLFTREGGGTSLCSPSNEYVSCPSVRRHIETLPSYMEHHRTEFHIRHNNSNPTALLSFRYCKPLHSLPVSICSPHRCSPSARAAPTCSPTR